MQSNNSFIKNNFKIKFPRDQINNCLIVWGLFINQIVIELTGKYEFTYLIFMLICANNLMTKKSRIEILLLYLIVPNKYLQLAGCVLFVVISIVKDVKKISVLFWESNLRYLVFCVGVLILNRLAHGGSLFTGFFQIALYCVILEVIYITDKSKISIDNFLLKQIFIVQVLLGLIEMGITHSTGDVITGTVTNAHWYGVFLICYGYTNINRLEQNHKKPLVREVALVALIAFMLYLCDAKHVWICFILAIMINWILERIHVKRKIFITFLGIYIGVFILIILLKLLSQSSLASNELIRTYILNIEYNKKFMFLNNIANEMFSVWGLIGFGPGQFGSQICLTMAKEVIYPWKYMGTIFTIAATPYREAIEGLMTKGYSIGGIAQSSMVLGYPLVSIAPFVAENGIIGIYLLATALEKIIKDYKDATFIIMLPLLFVFDTYLEVPCVTVMLIIFFIILNKDVKKGN